MSRLGIRLAFAFALLVAAAVAFLTHRNAEIIATSQSATLESSSALHLHAIRRVLSEEASGIVKKLEPLSRVRELRFRVEPASRSQAAPTAQPGDSRVADYGLATASIGSTEIIAETAVTVAHDSSDTLAHTAPFADSARASSSSTPAQTIEATTPLDPVGLQRFIEEVLPVTGLDSLEVTDVSGVVIARGHYPESFGEKRTDAALMAVIITGGNYADVRVEPFVDTGRVSLVGAVPIRSTDETGAAVVGMLSGGVRLDRLVGRLSELTGAIVEISTQHGAVTSTGSPLTSTGTGLVEESDGAYYAASGEIGPGKNATGEVRILVSAQDGLRSRQLLLSENARYGALAIFFAACAGIVLALGPTRRLTRLTKAAVGIGGGDLETPIEVRGGDEIGILGETLTKMTRALLDERARLATSERVAAWRDAAKRLAHELKNAITPIGLALRTVRRASEKGEEGRAMADEALAATEDELKHLQSLVDQFSQFARLPAPRFAPYDLARALKNAATIYSSSGTEMRMNIPELRTSLQADEELMGRVWSNLISNAVQAAGPKGWVEVMVHLTSDQRIEVVITDSGPGLTAERIASGAAEGASTKQGGWGVGLALAERIVAEHGGSITFENAEGTEEMRGGARIRVGLPLERMDTAARSAVLA